MHISYEEVQKLRDEANAKGKTPEARQKAFEVSYEALKRNKLDKNNGIVDVVVSEN